MPNYQKNFPQFKGDHKEKYLKGIDDGLARDLILKLIAIDPGRRISASDALEHPYFM